MRYIFELARGASEEQLDQIEAIIREELERADESIYFEMAVNRRLQPFNIQFAYTLPVDDQAGSMGELHNGIVYVRTPPDPKIMDAHTLAGKYRVVISHESVHQSQFQAAQRTGSSDKLMAGAGKLVTPSGQIDWKRYSQDPHENMAYAKTEVDMWRAMGLNRQQILQRLRSGKRSAVQYEPADRKRFLKNAYRYATESRAYRIVTNLLES